MSKWLVCKYFLLGFFFVFIFPVTLFHNVKKFYNFQSDVVFLRKQQNSI